ncbi:MAG: ester cyclase, partial [Nitrososphaeraceae archaeon]
MSNTQYSKMVRSFVDEIFNARNTEAAKNFVTPDIVYHGMDEEIKGIEDFKKWVSEDLSAFPDMKVTILDDFG